MNACMKQQNRIDEIITVLGKFFGFITMNKHHALIVNYFVTYQQAKYLFI